MVHWLLVGGLLRLVQRGGDWAEARSRISPRPLFVVPNVTAHPSAASVRITVLLYTVMVRCSAVLVAHKGLT